MKLKDKVAATTALLFIPFVFFPWPWIGGLSYRWIQMTGICGVVLTAVVWSLWSLWAKEEK